MKESFNERVCIVCAGIMWDTDGQDPDVLSLPESVVIDKPTYDMVADYSEGNDAVVNYLSDRYGFCVEGFSMHLGVLVSARNE